MIFIETSTFTKYIEHYFPALAPAPQRYTLAA